MQAQADPVARRLLYLPQVILRLFCVLALSGIAASGQPGRHGGGDSPQQGGRPSGHGGGAPDRASPRPAPGPAGSGKSLKDQIGAVRRRLGEESVFGADRQMLLPLAGAYLDRSEQAGRSRKQAFAADRLVAGAAALQQAIEFSQALPGARSAAQSEQARERLETVYFRTQEADYFRGKSGEPSAAPLPDLARRWYQKAPQFLESDPAVSENAPSGPCSTPSA